MCGAKEEMITTCAAVKRAIVDCIQDEGELLVPDAGVVEANSLEGSFQEPD